MCKHHFASFENLIILISCKLFQRFELHKLISSAIILFSLISKLIIHSVQRFDFHKLISSAIILLSLISILINNSFTSSYIERDCNLRSLVYKDIVIHPNLRRNKNLLTCYRLSLLTYCNDPYIEPLILVLISQYISKTY